MCEALKRAYLNSAGVPRQMGSEIRRVKMAVTVSGFCIDMSLLKNLCVCVDDGTAQVD